MKLTTPEIVWHNKQPLLSADFHRGQSILRLATGGADNDVKVSIKLTNPGTLLLTSTVCLFHVSDLEDF